jgi:hypothetical protein
MTFKTFGNIIRVASLTRRLLAAETTVIIWEKVIYLWKTLSALVSGIAGQALAIAFQTISTVRYISDLTI